MRSSDKIVTLAISCMLSGCHTASPKPAPPETISSAEVLQTPDKVYPKVLKFLAMNSVTASSINKDQGVIIASGAIAPSGWIECKRVRGDEVDQHFNLSISLDANGASTTVTVALNGQHGGKTRNHFLFIPTSSDTTLASCSTTGAMERALFAFVTQ